MYLFNYQKSKKGAALFLSVIILSFLLVIALEISTILLGQVRMLKSAENSVQAFFAADTGIEKGAAQATTSTSSPFSISGSLGNGATYSVKLIQKGPDCQADNYCLEGIGTFKQTRRAIIIRR